VSRAQVGNHLGVIDPGARSLWMSMETRFWIWRWFTTWRLPRRSGVEAQRNAP